MLVTTFYNMADTYFVGKIGAGLDLTLQAEMQTRAQAAVGVALPVMAIIQAFGFFFGHGSGNFVSRALGKHDTESATRVASSGFVYSIITGIVILLFGQLFAKDLAMLLGATEYSCDYAAQYMRIILIGAPINMAAMVLNNQMRFQGNATYAMMGITIGAVLNIGLDALFILAFDMEVIGAA
jgi:Na+-driven multidrug efflux pump